DEPGAHRPARAGNRPQEPGLRRQDLSGLFRRPGEAAMKMPALALRAGILLAIASPAHAALDPELKKPYKLDIVLHIADNRALTPLFHDELQRAVGDHLRQSFGALAEI